MEGVFGGLSDNRNLHASNCTLETRSPTLVCYPKPLCHVCAGRAQTPEQGGWQMSGAAVFQAPSSPLGLCVRVGAGLQIAASALLTLFVAAVVSEGLSWTSEDCWRMVSLAWWLFGVMPASRRHKLCSVWLSKAARIRRAPRARLQCVGGWQETQPSSRSPSLSGRAASTTCRPPCKPFCSPLP